MNPPLRIERVEAIDIHVEPYDWPFARERAADIDAHWQGLCAARPHLFNGRVSYLLPCLSRIEKDVQAGGPQTVSMEDSISRIHASDSDKTPASPHLLSEPAIVAGIAKATLEPNPKVPWDAWVGEYAKVREAIEQTWPATF